MEIDKYTPYEDATRNIIEFLRVGNSMKQASTKFEISERNVRRRCQVYWERRPNENEEKKWRNDRTINQNKKNAYQKNKKL
jgi:hypothetical protein